MAAGATACSRFCRRSKVWSARSRTAGTVVSAAMTGGTASRVHRNHHPGRAGLGVGDIATFLLDWCPCWGCVAEAGWGEPPLPVEPAEWPGGGTVDVAGSVVGGRVTLLRRLADGYGASTGLADYSAPGLADTSASCCGRTAAGEF